MKKILAVSILCCLLLCCISPAVSANAPGPNLDGTYDPNPAMTAILVVAVVILYLLLTVLTCFVEWLVAKPFGLHLGYKKTILVTNVVTQLVMHLLEALSFSFLPRAVGNAICWYLLTVLVLEVLVYVSEFLIYRKKMTGVPGKKILLYTVCANTASLLAGALLLLLIF